MSWRFIVKSTAHNTDFKTIQTAFLGPVLWEGARKPQEVVYIAAIMSRFGFLSGLLSTKKNLI